jgi:hypothetical protein
MSESEPIVHIETKAEVEVVVGPEENHDKQLCMFPYPHKLNYLYAYHLVLVGYAIMFALWVTYLLCIYFLVLNILITVT